MKMEDVVWQALALAVQRFNESEDPKTLLCPRQIPPKNKTERAAASERAITYRLAFYLESELRRAGVVGEHGPIIVDCEYNRHIGAGKELEGAEDEIRQIVLEARSRELKSDSDGFYVFSVAPDIVVHQRQTDENNLLVIEVKKRSNPETEEYDALKLELFTKPKDNLKGYGYKFGAWVVAEDKCDADPRCLRIIRQFKNGVGTECAE